jgi:hypothetical protein
MRTLLAISMAAVLAGCVRPKTTPEPPPAQTTEVPPAEAAPRVVPPPEPETTGAPLDDVAGTLRQANSAAANGQLAEANALYLSVVRASNASRDAVVNAATGLYRTGDFEHTARAFAKLGTFMRGEEDLRYYNAVALYETGRYAGAKHELSCALPYISVTPDVERYRAKIDAK